MACKPRCYPNELMELVDLPDGSRILLRPVVSRDADIFQEFVRRLSEESRRNRFHSVLRELPISLLDGLMAVDYDNHTALLAEVFNGAGEVMIGEARFMRGLQSDEAEFAIAVADPWQSKGLGSLLLRRLELCARQRGVESMFGLVLPGNEAMSRLASSSGYNLEAVGNPGNVMTWSKPISR
jgi:acetyltransferase